LWREPIPFGPLIAHQFFRLNHAPAIADSRLLVNLRTFSHRILAGGPRLKHVRETETPSSFAIDTGRNEFERDRGTVREINLQRVERSKAAIHPLSFRIDVDDFQPKFFKQVRHLITFTSRMARVGSDGSS
jgi:hypothetical protein